MTNRRISIPPETAETLSQRDLALLKLGRLMADNHPPEPEAAESDGDLIDISKLAEARLGAHPRHRHRTAGRPGRAARPTAKPETRPARGLLWRAVEVFIVLVVVVWVFVLGVLVGRSRPEENEHHLVVWLEKMAGWAPPRPALISDENRPDLPTEAAAVATAAATATGVKAARAESGLPEELPALPAGMAEPEAAPADEAPPPDPRALYAVQAIVAHNETEARNQVARLETLGFKAYFYQHANRFPVRVGPFPTRGEAEEQRQRLVALEYKEPYVSKLR